MQNYESRMTNSRGEKSHDRFIRFSLATDAIGKDIQRYKNEKLAQFGLRSMHLMYLYCLDKSEKGLTPVELSKHCSVDKAFISRVTTELKDLGYIDFLASEDGLGTDKKYKKRIHLTAEGKYVMDRINEMIGDAVDKITEGVTTEQLDTFYHVLALFNSNLCGLISTEA